MDTNKHVNAGENTADSTTRETWVKPEIVSFEPVKAAEGISYRPNDGISNLT
ncbi:MAG: hypothetical protein V4564_07935 [Pseudomonadota bacterium]|uniref:hypothetical protein n=1 Tax=Sphingomonas sp. ERG5 TaxID=1381597 RepID=UPI00136489A9|nr:hypothetical protein [Sphingomonas sp. ERG5]